MKRKVYIIPGYNDSHLTNGVYERIADLFRGKGIEPIHVEVRWNRSHPEKMSDYVDDFLRIYQKGDEEYGYVFGFSLGAMVALLGAAKVTVDTLILCSLSPYFIEDYDSIPQDWLQAWQKDYVESNFSFDEISSTITSKVFAIVGELEDSAIISRAKEVKKKFHASELFIVKNNNHNLDDKEYLDIIGKAIETL